MSQDNRPRLDEKSAGFYNELFAAYRANKLMHPRAVGPCYIVDPNIKDLDGCYGLVEDTFLMGVIAWERLRSRLEKENVEHKAVRIAEAHSIELYRFEPKI